MALDYEAFNPSVDLVKEATRYIEFLRCVNEEACWLNKDHVIKNAIRRYETIWLPLVVKHENEELIPPLDVHWVWTVHQLCPRMYAKDCERITSRILRHCFYNQDDELDNGGGIGQKLWLDKSPHEPFDVDFSEIPNDETIHHSQIEYDIVSASRRQMAFFYNVSLPHFRLNSFLETASIRYRKFVNLKKCYSDTFIVPTYDVDLMWHTHQLHPTEYRSDTTQFLGYVLNHDDSTTDRQPGSKLYNGCDETQKAWQELYQEPFAMPGVMYRGEHPRSSLQPLNQEQVWGLFPKIYTVRVDKVEVTGNVKAKYRLAGSLSVLNHRDSAEALDTQKDMPFKWESSSKGGFFTFDVGRHRQTIKLVIERRDGVKGALFGKTFLSTQFKVSNAAVESACTTEEAGNHTLTLSNDCSNGVKASVSLSVVRSRGVDATFAVDTGCFTPSILEPDDRNMWGPVTLPSLPEGKVNSCNVATHTITNHAGDDIFTARVIHSPPLNTCVLQIFRGDGMVVVGHLVGPEQLPNSEQMQSDSSECVTLNPRRGERAMLIKNADGDYGILKGAWSDYKKGKPPKVSGQTGKRGDPGYLTVAFYHCVHDVFKESTLMNRRGSGGARNRKFKLHQVAINVAKNDLTVDGNCRHVAENIALGLAVNIMYVLCEPRMRPPGIYPERKRSSINPPTKNIRRRGSVAVQSLNSGGVHFFNAAGYMTETPSNSWLFWQWHRRFHTDEPDTEYANEKEMLDDLTHCNGVEHDGAIFCPWNPDAIADGMDPSGCGGCGGCAASCGGTSATCGISTACGGPAGSGDEDDDGND